VTCKNRLVTSKWRKTLQLSRNSLHFLCVSLLRSVRHRVSGSRPKWTLCGFEKNQNIPHQRWHSDDNIARNLAAQKPRLVFASAHCQVTSAACESFLHPTYSQKSSLKTFRCDPSAGGPRKPAGAVLSLRIFRTRPRRLHFPSADDDTHSLTSDSGRQTHTSVLDPSFFVLFTRLAPSCKLTWRIFFQSCSSVVLQIVFFFLLFVSSDVFSDCRKNF
jgi:hypothetical protein